MCTKLVLHCAVLTLTRRMSSKIGSRGHRGAAIIWAMQTEASTWPSHALTLLFHKSTTKNVRTIHTIQYTVDKAKVEVMMARSHFRGRLWIPLVLYHHDNPLRKRSIGKLGDVSLTP